MCNCLAVQLDAGVADFAVVAFEQAGDCVEGCALAGAVCPEQRDDLALRDFQRQSLENEDHAIVADLDVVEPQQCTTGMADRSGPRSSRFCRSSPGRRRTSASARATYRYRSTCYRESHPSRRRWSAPALSEWTLSHTRAHDSAHPLPLSQ